MRTTKRSAWGQSLFCDDLRPELNGKISLMGLYQTDIVFPKEADFPILIPKMVIFIKYNEAKGEFKHDLELKVFFPGISEPVASVPVPREQLDGAVVPHPPDEDSEPVLSVTVPLVFSPVQFLAEGPIKVRMHCGSHVTRLGRLMVRKAFENEGIIFPSVSQPPSSQSPPGAPTT